MNCLAEKRFEISHSCQIHGCLDPRYTVLGCRRSKQVATTVTNVRARHLHKISVDQGPINSWRMPLGEVASCSLRLQHGRQGEVREAASASHLPSIAWEGRLDSPPRRSAHLSAREDNAPHPPHASPPTSPPPPSPYTPLLALEPRFSSCRRRCYILRRQ